MAREQQQFSSLVLAILGLVSGQPMSGYDLRKIFATTAMRHFSDSPGAVYPALRRCERQGWLTSKTGNPGSRRQRQVFSLTARGRAALESSLARPVTRDDVVRRPDELILRFAFIGELLDRRRTRQFLTDYLREVEAHLAGLRREVRASRDRLTPTARLALEHGVEGYAMEARWARRALEEL